MLFSSLIFLFYFLPVFLAIYLLSPRKYHNFVLLTFSLIFYAWGEPRFIPLLVFIIAANYLAGLLIDQSHGTARKAFLWLGVLGNIGILALFKYSNFLLGIGEDIFNVTFPFPRLKHMMLPLGISFFTFKALTYIIDVYRGRVTATKNFTNLATYIFMFPQLVAGPIVRYEMIEHELRDRSISAAKLLEGSKLLIIGLASKVIFANQLAIYADDIFSKAPEYLSMGLSWLGAVSYTLQIYFDFAGYSLMAIGLGKMIGFNTPDNFNLPYLSRSVTEFWRRWHITLSSWFREYLYIPLGGNRRGKLVTYRNLFVVFLLCGIWHGANFTFLVWGVYHGFFLILERWSRDHRGYMQMPRLIRHIYLLLVITVGWVIFRSDNLGYALDYIGVMFGIIDVQEYYTVNIFSHLPLIALLLTSIVCSSFNERSILALKNRAHTTLAGMLLGRSGYAVVLLVCVVILVINTHNPFIYLRF